MSQQPDNLKLRELPPLTPPRDVLPAVLAGTRAGNSPATPHWPLLAAAAAALVAIGLVWTMRSGPQLDADPMTDAAGPAMVSTDSETVRALDDWIEYSQQLESQLRALQPESTVLHGHRAAAINLLQEEMALIDFALAQTTQPDESLLLWQARTARLNDLVAVHVASANALSLDADRDPGLDPVITLQPPLAAAAVSVQL